MFKETPLPYLSWSDTMAVEVNASPINLNNYTAVTLSDGKRRSFTGTLSVDFTSEGEGGLDAGEDETKWYKVFLVPTTADDDSLCAMATDNTIATGPDGKTAWRYIGSVRRVQTAGVPEFIQLGNEFAVPDNDTWHVVRSGAADGTATNGQWHVDNMWGDAAFPAHANTVELGIVSTKIANAWTYIEPSSSSASLAHSGTSGCQAETILYVGSDLGSNAVLYQGAKIIPNKQFLHIRESAVAMPYYSIHVKSWTESLL